MSQLAITHYHQPLSRLSEAQQLVVRHEIQALLQNNPETGWSKARSLSPQDAVKVADF